MRDQTFSAKNFRHFIEQDNRRGLYLEDEFFPSLDSYSRLIKEKSGELRDLRKLKRSLDSRDYESRKKAITDSRREIQTNRNECLLKEMTEVGKTIESGKFRISMIDFLDRRGNRVFKLDKSDPVSYFAIRKIQSDIRSIYKVKQSNRREIISQLRGVLSDTFPKIVVRTDISSFYESIQSQELIRKLDTDGLVSATARRIVRQLLHDYQKLANSLTGIPRGIGISAYLAELAMRNFDKSIRNLPDTIFYARYVDDIVVVFRPDSKLEIPAYVPRLEEQVDKLGLKLNRQKTEVVDLRTKKSSNIEYLGYKIRFGDCPGTVICLSQKRIKKYRDRIRCCFEAYNSESRIDTKKAGTLLLKRVRFLTANTRLHNNKSNALVGAYFSNSQLSNGKVFGGLDEYLKSEIQKVGTTKLQTKLAECSFLDGYEQKRFYRFTPDELNQIVSAW